MRYLDYADLANPRKEDSHHTYDFLKDVPVIVSAEVARKNMTIREILSLRKGSTIGFDKLLGEPIDMVVVDKNPARQRVTARGEIVVLNERYGCRVTSVESTQEKKSTEIVHLDAEMNDEPGGSHFPLGFHR